jgi:hypothetical protein
MSSVEDNVSFNPQSHCTSLANGINVHLRIAEASKLAQAVNATQLYSGCALFESRSRLLLGYYPEIGHYPSISFSVCHLLISLPWDSAVGIATGYRLDDRSVGVRAPVGSRILSSPRRPDRLWGPPSLLFNAYWGSSLGGKTVGA